MGTAVTEVNLIKSPLNSRNRSICLGNLGEDRSTGTLPGEIFDGHKCRRNRRSLRRQTATAWRSPTVGNPAQSEVRCGVAIAHTPESRAGMGRGTLTGDLARTRT